MLRSFGISYSSSMPLDLSFLVVDRPEHYAGHLFFDNTRKALQESSTARETIARLNLNYYIPCTVQGRTIAVLGFGKTVSGDFLSSEDVELWKLWLDISASPFRMPDCTLHWSKRPRVRTPERFQ